MAIRRSIWRTVTSNTNRSFHEDPSPQARDCTRNCWSSRSGRAAQSSAAPINGKSIKAAVPAVTTDVRYRAYRDYPYASYSGYPTYYYYGYPYYWTYSPYYVYPQYYGYGW